jgi:hypothetical protein
MASINPTQDYDAIHTLTFASASGTCRIRLYRGSYDAYTGTVYYRAGTSGAWTSLSVSGTSTTFPVTSTTMQVAHDWNKDGNNYMTPSFYGQSTNLVGISISQKAVLSGTVGDYFMYRYAYGCSSLKSLSVPDTSGLTSVGDGFMRSYAQGCSSLTSLSVPDTSGLESVGSSFVRSYAQDCSSLTSLSVPDTSGLTSVGDFSMYSYAQGCTNLTSLSVPDTSGLESVGANFMVSYARDCSSLTSLILPDSTGWFGSYNVSWSVPSGRLGYLYGYTPNSLSQTAWQGLTTSGKTLYTNYIRAEDHVLIPLLSGTSERNLYTKGKGTGNSERNLYSSGKTTDSSERLLRSIGGGIVSSERGIYTASGAGESERGIYSYGKPNPVAIPFYQGKNEKRYSVKIYDRAGTTFKGNYDPIGGYAFTKTINGGVGALSITLPRKFDNFGLGEDVNLLDEIQVWIQDKDTSGKKIYSGYVSSITSFIDGSNQGIKLDVLGYVSRLAFTLDWNGTDISMVRNSLTAGELVKDVIDKYRSTVSEERINYGTGTVDITGSDISYTSNAKSCLETIERAREMAGATWYWYVDADNVFYFREYATTPTHLFTFGKDISSLEITRSADDIKNEFIFWNGLMADDTNFISNRYYNTNSINSYWNRFEANTDGRVTTSAGADALGDSYINAYKNPNVSMRFEVKDNNLGAGYDIESIEPGHTCKILNLNDSDVVGDNMVITSVQYTPEKVIIYVSDLREITGRSLTNLRRQLDTTVYGDRPTKLTSKAIT